MRFDTLIPIAASALLLAGCATGRTGAGPVPVAPLRSVAYSKVKPRATQTAVVILHDDVAGDAPVDRAALAERAAAAVPAGAAVLLLRPGYAAPDGTRSDGERGDGIGDGYGPDAIRLVGESLRSIRAKYADARIVLLGEGGGAALAANVASARPQLVDAMLLVDCPCALPEWRKARARKDKRFAAPVDSLDPLQTAGGIMSRTRVGMLSREDMSRYARPYAEALALRGIATEYRETTDPAATTLDDPELLDMLSRLARPAPDKADKDA